MSTLASKVDAVFRETFSTIPHLYYSPGRINLIGEHIDYNDGFVMPAAIDQGMYYAMALNNSDTIHFYALDFAEKLAVKISDVKKMSSWKNYVLSVVNEFIIAGLPVQGFDCVFGGDIANGGGLSSSAAVEGGVSFGLNELLNAGLSRKELALLGQRAEHNFPGVMCGIMDQYANMLGKKDQVLLLDCKSVEHQYLPLELTGYKIVLINSKVHHSLASSEYNVRRKQCEEGLAILKGETGITSFRDIENPADIAAVKDKMPATVYMRCLYVVEEIHRTQMAARQLQQNNLIEFGKLMFESHDGLKNLYQVSCKELDFLVDLAKVSNNVIGARLMGGGFGGCTINIIRETGMAEFLDGAITSYQKTFHIDPEIYQVGIMDGTHRIGAGQ